uniref:hypothetical protein n=1 Tax=Rhizobium meliloti TaxID=382 RepID=UPI0021BD0189|nr:hypothetical protein [Sinorhizobium meliloti]
MEMTHAHIVLGFKDAVCHSAGQVRFSAGHAEPTTISMPRLHRIGGNSEFAKAIRYIKSRW